MWDLLLHIPEHIAVLVFEKLDGKGAVRLLLAWPKNYLQNFAGYLASVDLPEKLQSNQFLVKWLWSQSLTVRIILLKVNSWLSLEQSQEFISFVGAAALEVVSESCWDNSIVNRIVTQSIDESIRQKVTSIKVIYLLDTNDQYWTALSEFRRLEELTINLNSTARALRVRDILRSCQTLRSLTIENATTSTAGLLMTLFDIQTTVNLTSLRVFHHGFTEKELIAIRFQRMLYGQPDVSNNQSPAILATLAGICPKLQSLVMDLGQYCTFPKSDLLLLLQCCKDLRVLDINTAIITDAVLLAMVEHSLRLTTLSLTWAVTSQDTVLTAQHLLNGLQELTLLMNQSNDFPLCIGTLNNAMAHTTNLIKLVSRDEAVNSQDVCSTITTSCRRLRSINMHVPSIIHPDPLGEMLVQMAQNMCQLESIYLRGQWCFSEECLLQSLPYLRKVRTLDLHFTSTIYTDAVVVKIAQCCPFIEAFNLGMENDVTDVGILALAEHSRRLRDLDVFYCSKVSEDALLQLVQRCRCLKSVKLPWNCHAEQRLHAASQRVVRLPGCKGTVWK